jgi:CheY-like chemotaxis protein
MNKDKELTVLLVEDSAEDAFFVRRALRKSEFNGEIRHVTDGQQAIDYLSGASGFTDRSRFPFPDVVLTDLKMPRVTGFELLQWIREDKRFQNLPVAVLTSSQLDEDRSRAESLLACAYLVKDILLRDRSELMATLRKCGSQDHTLARP